MPKLDDNTAGRDARIAAYRMLSEATRSKVDARARAVADKDGRVVGFANFLEMVNYWWKKGFYSLLGGAEFGPRAGLLEAMDRAKQAFMGLFKKKEKGVAAEEPSMPDVLRASRASGVQDQAIQNNVFADLNVIQGNTKPGPERTAALENFFTAGKK